MEKALFAFAPIRRTVPITKTRITASITASSAISWPSSFNKAFRRFFNMGTSIGPFFESGDRSLENHSDRYSQVSGYRQLDFRLTLEMILTVCFFRGSLPV